jgi:hypothetical protein
LVAAGSSTCSSSSSSVVYDDLKEVVKAYRVKHGVKGTDSVWACVWGLFWLVAHVYALVRWAAPSLILSTAAPSTGGVGVGASSDLINTINSADNIADLGQLEASFDYANAILLGLSLWYWSVDIMHSGTHYALCHNSRASEWVAWLGGVCFHTPSGWVRQHVTGHHVHTNHHGADPDLAHWPSFRHLGGGWRVTTLTRYRSVFKRWAMSFIPVMTIAALGPCLLESLSMLLLGSYPGSSKASNKRIGWAPGEKAVAWATWGCTACTITGVAIVHGPAHALAPWALLGTIYYVCSQVSHVNGLSLCHHIDDTAAAAAAAAAGQSVPPAKEWAVSQILSAQGKNHLFLLCWPSTH